MEDIFLVEQVTGNAPARRRMAVVPAFRVDGVSTEEVQCSGIDFFFERAHHTVVFKLIEPPGRGGKHDDWQSGVPKDEQLHLPAEPARIPLAILAIHCLRAPRLEAAD